MIRVLLVGYFQPLAVGTSVILMMYVVYVHACV